MEHFLQPGMTKLPSFLKDTKHVLQILEDMNEKIEKGELTLDGVNLITLDVEKMYNTMTEELALAGTKSYLEERSQDIDVTTESILRGLDICLKNNFFQFKEQIFQQISGVGTGLKLAPPYACLGMGEYEKRAFGSPQPLLEKILLWKRYIDDVFGLFKGSKKEFESLVTWLNSLIPGVVKFTATISDTQVEFLDLVIKIENGRLKSDLFIKPTNQQLYLNYNSNHPEPCKTGLIYGQALRIMERCTDAVDASSHLKNLETKLIDRKYPEDLVKRHMARAQTKDRRTQIFKKRTPAQKDNKVRLIFTYNQNNPPIQKWIRQSRKFLDRNEKAKELGKNIQIAYKQPRNIKKLVGGPSKSGGRGSEMDPGCKKCTKKCHACKVLKEGQTFRSTNTKKIYKIKQKVDCQSSYIIYLGTCMKCQGQYVGKSSQQFRKRHSGHKQEIKNQIGGLGQHYGGVNGCGYENLRITIIEQVEVGNGDQLGRREIFWQNQLRCFIENGGQAQCKRKEK